MLPEPSSRWRVRAADVSISGLWSADIQQDRPLITLLLDTGAYRLDPSWRYTCQWSSKFAIRSEPATGTTVTQVCADSSRRTDIVAVRTPLPRPQNATAVQQSVTYERILLLKRNVNLIYGWRFYARYDPSPWCIDRSFVATHHPGWSMHLFELVLSILRRHAYATVLRLSVICLSVRNVLWLNVAS